MLYRYIKGVYFYLDDVLIASKTLSEHLTLIEKVIRILKNHNLKLNFNKCIFVVEELDFLGFTLTKVGIKPQKSKFQVLDEFKVPKTLKNVRSLVGFLSFFRSHIPKFAHIMKPITNLLKEPSHRLIKWNDECEEAKIKVVELLKQSFLLYYPDFNKPFIIYTDSSNFAAGAALCQKHEKKLVPLAFYSVALSASQRNYTVQERELLCVVQALNKWRQIIYNQTIKVYSDCKPLSSLLQNQSFKSARLVRWALLLQEFAVTIVYLPGSKQFLADFLSRLDIHKPTDSKFDICLIESNVNTTKFKCYFRGK